MTLKRVLFPALAVLALPAVGLAHPGHEGHELTWDFGTGVIHPLTGWDHLVAMVATGLWAYQLGGRAKWLVPAAFVAAMIGGAALGRDGIALPGIEQGIAASLLVLGLLIATATRLPVWAGMILAALFACYHGYAHGAAAGPAGGLSYAMGFLGASALLHLAGLRLGSLLLPDPRAVRVVGGLVASAGFAAIVLS